MVKPGKIQIIKYAPPPPELPIYGQSEPDEVSFIGRTNYAATLEEKRFIFGIRREDRRRHLYIIGKSGTGKSKLIELLIRQDIGYGYGLCLIDPYGDMIGSVLDAVPEKRLEDVVIVDPADSGHPVAFNPLRDVHPGFRHQLAQGFIEAMQKQFGDSWTPRLEHVFRFAVLALLDYPHATMRGIMLMLTDHEYRAQVIGHIRDAMVKRFWTLEFSEWSEKFNTDAVIPLVNKLGQFLSDPLLGSIFGQEENRIDFVEFMNRKRIILVSLAKGILGEGNAAFLGAIFIAKIRQAGMMRAAALRNDRRDFYLYVDECNTLVTETFENVLSEAHKYGLCLTIAHQYLGQLAPRMQMAAIGNVGSIIIFRISGEDAARLKQEMAPVFDVKDMINLGAQEFYMKMTIDGESYDPFSAEALRVLDPPHSSFREAIIDRSRKSYNIDHT